MSNLNTEDPAANAGTWTEVPRQLKQKRCHECSKRTFYWLFEAEGAICTVCVNLRTMPRPIPQSVSAAESTSGKKRKSTVAPTIKNAILAKRACGQSKLSIAKEMHVAPGTVRNVLNEADFDQQVQQGRLDSVRLIPAAINGLEKSMGKGDGSTCIRFLEGVGIIGENVRRIPTPANDALMRAIVNLIDPEAAKPAIDAEVVTGSSSPS
jgi:uncharacterized membrane protein